MFSFLFNSHLFHKNQYSLIYIYIIILTLFDIFIQFYISSKRPETKVKWVGRGVHCILSAENQTTKQLGVSLTQKKKADLEDLGKSGKQKSQHEKVKILFQSFCF